MAETLTRTSGRFTEFFPNKMEIGINPIGYMHELINNSEGFTKNKPTTDVEFEAKYKDRFSRRLENKTKLDIQFGDLRETDNRIRVWITEPKDDGYAVCYTLKKDGTWIEQTSNSSKMQDNANIRLWNLSEGQIVQPEKVELVLKSHLEAKKLKPAA